MLFNTVEEWKAKVIQCTLREVTKGKAVLIICLTVDQTRMFEEALSKVYQRSKIKLYYENHVGQERTIEECHEGDIMIATNLAGRGTDIKTTDIKKQGGLHVLLTYVPESQRVQKQAEGRTGRNGDKGSTQIVALRKPGKTEQ